jgi:uncharacterized repeat protein (TIGR01451 family)
MKPFNSTAAVLMMVVLVLVPLAGGWDTRTKWDGGDESFLISSDLITGGQWTRNFTMARNSEVRTATMRVQGQPFVMDPGQEFQTLHWPANPSLDVLGDGTPDWAFPGLMGLQQNIAANTTEVDLRWDGAGQTRNLDIKIPRSTINQFSLSIANAQTSKFSYSMAIGEQPVWSKDSLSFSYNQTAFTKESLNYVTSGDINGDPWPDLVGCGANGKVYVSRSINGKFGNASIIDCQVEAVQKDMLMIAVGDLDGNPGNDLAVACADGNIYFLLNQGGAGLFGGASRIEPGTTSRMASVAIADVDADGINDIVAGNLNGRFYVFFNDGGAQFDTSGGPGSGPFKVITAGNGQMNDVCVEDINLDTFPDIIGANSNRQFYIAPSIGGRDFDNAFPVVTGAIRDLNSVDAVDIDKDQDFDLVGASNDGKIYICINLGNAQGFNAGEFNTQPGSIIKLTCESGTNSLRTSIVRDINGDEWPDILALGTSNNGQVYLATNDGFGAYPDTNLYKVFSAGQSSKGIAAGALVRAGFVDIVAGNGNRFDVWKNNQGPFTDTLAGPALVSAVQTFVDAATPVPDVYGNPWVTVRLSIYNRYTGQLHFSALSINYTYNALVDFTSQLSAHLNATAGPDESPVVCPVVFKMDSAGSLQVSELHIESQIGLVALIDFPSEGAQLFKDRAYTLQGRSNYDPDGTLFNYTWTDLGSGRLLGYGSRIQYTPAALGNVSIQLKVRNDLGGKEVTSTVHVAIVEEPAANIVATKVVATPKTPKPGETVSLKITFKNTGLVNATNIGFQLFIDKPTGIPAASGSIDRIDKARTAQTEIFWSAGSPGNHKLIIHVESCDQKFTTINYSPGITVAKPVEFDWAAVAAGIIILFVVVGVVAFLVKRRLDAAAIQKAKEAPAAGAAGVEGPAAQQVASAPSPAITQDMYAADRSGQTDALYAAATEAASPTKKRFTCPRCGKTTEEEGLLCLECNSKDSIAGARAAIAEADEMALDVEHPQELLKKAEEAFSAGNFADAIEHATEAEDEARGTKERFEEASAFATGKKRAIDLEEDAPAPKAGGPVLGPSLGIGDDSPKAAPRPVVKPTVVRSEGPVTGPSLKAGDAGRTDAPAPGPVVTLKPGKCPNCGKEVQARWKICPNCQGKL